MLRIVIPAAIALLALIAWDLTVRLNEIPHYILPGPGLVLNSLIEDPGHAVRLAHGDPADHVLPPF